MPMDGATGYTRLAETFRRHPAIPAAPPGEFLPGSAGGDRNGRVFQHVPLAGLVREGAEVAHDAGRTVGFARLADVAAVQNQPVMRVGLPARRDIANQLALDLLWRLALRQTGAVGNAEDMGIDRDGGLAERH